MVVNNGEIEQIFEEPGKVGNCPIDPYSVSSPEHVLEYLKNNYSKEN
jgi:peroxiredoxin